MTDEKHLFSLFGDDRARDMLESSLDLFPLSFDLFDRFVSCSRQTLYILTDVNDDEYRVSTVLTEERDDLDVILFDFWPTAVKADNFLPR